MRTKTFFLDCIILLIALQGTSSKPSEQGGQLATNGSAHCPTSQSTNVVRAEKMKVNGLQCTCNVRLMNPNRDDYKYSPGIGWHKLHTRAKTWNEARKICTDEGGHLAIINSFAEKQVLMDLYNQVGLIKNASYDGEAYLGIHKFFESDWVTLHGESLEKAGYNEWSDLMGGQPDNMGGMENCGAFLKEGGMNDVYCWLPFPFFCEIPLVHIF